MEISVRKARKTDAAKIFQLMQEQAAEQNSVLPQHLTPEAVQEGGWGGAPTFLAFVAESTGKTKGSEGALKGYVLGHYAYYVWNGRNLYLTDLFVSRAYRRTGIATHLCKNIIQAGLEKGCCVCDIKVRKANQEGVNLFTALGAENLTKAEGWHLFNMDRAAMLRLRDASVGSAKVRKAASEDFDKVRAMIQELADYEKMPDGPQVDAQTLKEDATAPENFLEVFVVEVEDELVGYVLLFHTFSQGRGVFMDDFYVKESFRGQGLGTALWQQVVKRGLETGAHRCDFTVVAWNAPSIAYYKKRGAADMTEEHGLQLFRLDLKTMRQLVSE